ncbi:MAG TPA: hypothetical protein PKD52_07240 [Clostridiales bacterium]|nr:hypothetical protein [Clostridiales bacterium]
MKKTLILLCLLLSLLFLAACGNTEEDSDSQKEEDVSYISETEAEIYFYEITSVYRGELLQMTEDELVSGVLPLYWQGLSEPVATMAFDDLSTAYLSEEEKTALGKAYGVDAANKTFDIYSIADLQDGVDRLFGPDRFDVSRWDQDNVDIVSHNIFGTAAGYFLCAKDDENHFETQIYKVISVTPGENEAVVKAYAVSIDNITNHLVYDMSAVTESTEDSAKGTKTYKVLENADASAYDYGEKFDANIANMGIAGSSLGVIDFVLGISGIAIHLDYAAAES